MSELVAEIAKTATITWKEPAEDDDVDTASSSSQSDNVDTIDDMPLFKYARLAGSLPRATKANNVSIGGMDQTSHPLSLLATCSAMGKTILAPEVGDTSDANKTVTTRSSDLVWRQPHFLMAMGFQNGAVYLVDANTGMAIASPDQLRVKEGSGATTIVDVSFDTSGNFLAAMNASGMCAIWEIKYAAASGARFNKTSSTPASPETPAQPENNVFASFLTNLKGPSNVAPATSSHTTVSSGSNKSSSGSNDNTASMPSLTTSSIQLSRINYPASFGKPTCMSLDPSYKRRREKSILVGFADGRLIFTKRTFVFQRRNDSIVYQGAGGMDYRGIEAIEWRGQLVAWADASGIKVFDVETMSRIAHVDRPTGARPSLYPTISSLRPNMIFETSDNLLVAWGDCVMSMSIKETVFNRKAVAQPEMLTGASAVTAAGGSAPANNSLQETAIVRRRTVECTMAWELDCVACGVVPLDDNHVVILGLVPTVDDEGAAPQDRTVGRNDLEVQVVSRAEGSVTYSDALPLLRHSTDNGLRLESAAGYTLLSSFALPRMEDSVEAEEDRLTSDDLDDTDFQISLFTSVGGASKAAFKDPHRKWSLQHVSYHDEFDVHGKGGPKTQIEQSENVDSDISKSDGEGNDAEYDIQSEDSDDYDFILRPPLSVTSDPVPASKIAPPIMLIVSPADAVVVRAREVDDAVSHALSAGKPGLALRRALHHKRQLRRYDVNQVIDEYLRAVLRMNYRSGEATSSETSSSKDSPQAPLSLRRLKIAAEAMPTLLGGNIRMWEKWTNEFSKIPGGLFVLREYLPVRDPKLPQKLYEATLTKLLSEVEGMGILSTEEVEKRSSSPLLSEAMRHMLASLSAWGPTQSLREKIQFYKYHDDQQRKKAISSQPLVNAALLETEIALQRRLFQTAVGYLQLPSSTLPPSVNHHEESQLATNATLGSKSDSLFDVDKLISAVSSRDLFAKTGVSTGSPSVSNRPALEAFAELNMMKGRYELALKCFLAIGRLYSRPALDVLENRAVDAVNETRVGKREKDMTFHEGSHQYGHVLAMIEYHHLHRFLLDENFDPTATEGHSTLISLIQLVGLDNIGDFLVEHCVPPSTTIQFGSTGSLSLGSAHEETSHSETLPINLVAEQLSPHPKLLHWYLHQIFVRKPEMYVKFPNTAVPPKSVTDLHRSHLDLYIEYTDKKDSARSLSGTEIYKQERMSTPLLSFLKAALPLGGIRSDEVRRLLEAQRRGDKQGVVSDAVEFPHSFAIELAFVIENFGIGSEEDAKTILDLYLNGSKSLLLAVSYAQRNTAYSSLLWKILIEHCLKKGEGGTDGDGSLFGALLECAALCGADLAKLVTQIPQGMRIEGLRPRLVAAVADYRLKLKMHLSASETGAREKVALLRELTYRSKRGMRYQVDASLSIPSEPVMSPPQASTSSASLETKHTTLPHPINRPNRHRCSFALAIR